MPCRRGSSCAGSGGSWGGLDAAVAVAMVPTIGYGFASLIGTFPNGPFFNPTSQFSWSVFLIGVATIVVGLIAFAPTLFSFLFFTVTVAVSITSQIFLPLIDYHPSGDGHLITAIVVGAGLVVLGLLLDLAGRRRDAFWFHAIGLLNVAIALGYYATGIGGDANRGWIPMILAGAFVLIASAPLLRATWAVYGI